MFRQVGGGGQVNILGLNRQYAALWQRLFQSINQLKTS